MAKKKLSLFIGGLIIFAVLACCCLFFGLVFFLYNSRFLNDVNTFTLDGGSVDQTVAVIDIEGEITATGSTDIFGNKQPDMASEVIAKLDKAMNDDNVKAVLLRINSPGGEVYASKVIYDKILDVKSKGKKVVVLMKSEAASGAYFISAPADKIVASDMTLTGSIGVKFDITDLSGLYDKVGIKEISVAQSNGKFKVLKNLDDQTSDDYKLLQGIADDYYSVFVKAVAAGRHLTEDQVRQLGDGRVYSGAQAKQNKLIDELGELGKAEDVVKQIANLDKPNFVLYDSNPNNISALGMAIEKTLNPLSDYVQRLNVGPGIKAYYLMNSQ